MFLASIIRRNSYEDGLRDGYARAKAELRSQAAENVAKTKSYLDRDAESLSQKVAVHSLFLDEKVQMYLLPRWKLTLLGDDYIVRRPLRADWTDAWFMTEADSRDIDDQIETMLRGTQFEINGDLAGLAKREIHHSIQTLLKDQSTRVSGRPREEDL